MSRVVRFEAKAPVIITSEEAKFPIGICACGLSDKFPYCNGNHMRTKDEDYEKVYRYTLEGREVVTVSAEEEE